ncbi:MAG: hypothetical protein KGL53_09665 [Elusimicrobia bacterium]|nr:hypothetical protein [Elusimicrobiota bacterium]
MPEAYAFDELTKQMVAAQCRGAADAQTRAARIAVDTIVAGLKGTRAAHASQKPAESVRLIVEGMVAGLVLADCDFVAACMDLLRHLTHAAQETSIDPMEMLTWAMEGIALKSPLLPADRVSALGSEIDSEFMGAGAVFSSLCHSAKSAR